MILKVEPLPKREVFYFPSSRASIKTHPKNNPPMNRYSSAKDTDNPRPITILIAFRPFLIVLFAQ